MHAPGVVRACAARGGEKCARPVPRGGEKCARARNAPGRCHAEMRTAGATPRSLFADDPPPPSHSRAHALEQHAAGMEFGAF